METHRVLDGEIMITPHDDRSGWFLVEIGRLSSVKRFNIRYEELLLLDKQIHELPGAGGPEQAGGRAVTADPPSAPF